MTRTFLRWLYHQIHGKPLGKASPRKPRRGPARDYRYKAWIRSLPSMVSGKHGCEAAHTGSDGGMSMKASDYTCVPLTPEEHREYHQIGRASFERKYGVSFQQAVRRLSELWFSLGRLTK